MPFYDLNSDDNQIHQIQVSDEDAYLLLVNEMIQSPCFEEQIPKYLDFKKKLSNNKHHDYKVLDKIIKALVYGWAGEIEKSFDLLCNYVKSMNKATLVYKGNNSIYAALNLYIAKQFVALGHPIQKSEFYREAVKICREEDNYKGLIDCFELQCQYYASKKDYQGELMALLEKVKYYRFVDNKVGIVQSHIRIAESYAKQQLQDEWEKYTELALDRINLAEADPALKATIYRSIGHGYMQFEMYKEAAESIRNSIVCARELGISKEFIESYKNLEYCYTKNQQLNEVKSCEKNIRVLEAEFHKKEQEDLLQKLELIHMMKVDEQLSDTVEEYEEKLQAVTNKLDLTTEETERMIVLLSHDLKEPVRGITSFVSLLDRSLSKTSMNDKERDYLQFIKQNANTIAAHLEHLLKYIQLDNHEQEISDIDLNELVREVKDEVMKQQKDKSVILSYTKLPVIRGNKDMLHLLFYNLIENAIKFNDNTPLVKIDYKQGPKKAEIIISDNGIGVSDENKEKVFELFRKVHKNGKYDGWGVGLSMSRKIVNQLGGDIKIEDNLNGGSKVKFYFSADRVA